MIIENFGGPAELQNYVVDNTIAQAAIVQIVFDGSRWWIFHF